MNQPAIQVIKVGGANLDKPEYVEALTHYLRERRDAGVRVVLVHGGGKEIGILHDKLDVPFRKHLGLRVTSAEGMDIVSMVLCGLVNKRLVAHLNACGLRALGVSGADMGVLRSSYLNFDQLGQVGGPPKVDAAALSAILDGPDLVVIAPVCAAADGSLLNVNADAVAQSIAVSLGADFLDFVTDVDAVRTPRGNASKLSARQIAQLVRDDIVDGGMIPKLQAGVAASDGGVASVRVGSLQSLSQGKATEVHA